MLEMKWDRINDTLVVEFPPESAASTRGTLSKVAKIYDPWGWCVLVLLEANFSIVKIVRHLSPGIQNYQYISCAAGPSGKTHFFCK